MRGFSTYIVGFIASAGAAVFDERLVVVCVLGFCLMLIFGGGVIGYVHGYSDMLEEAGEEASGGPELRGEKEDAKR